jgi:hypothetical protein
MSKGKKRFEEWLDSQRFSPFGYDIDASNISGFYNIPFSMQWGVYLSFFDSVRIHLDAFIGKSREKYHYEIFGDGIYKCEKTFDTRTEAQKEAIKKAFEILEERYIR